MDDYVRDWMKSLLILEILVSICDILLENTKYEKYLYVFSGFIFMSFLMRPIADLTGIQDIMDISWIRTSFISELESAKDFHQLDMERDLHQQYGKIIENQIIKMAGAKDISVRDVQIEFDREEGTIKQLVIRTADRKAGEKKKELLKLQEILSEFYGIEKDKVCFTGERYGKEDNDIYQ